MLLNSKKESKNLNLQKIKELFLNNFHSKVQLTINDNINYSIFEMYDKKETYTVISKQGKFVAGI